MPTVTPKSKVDVDPNFEMRVRDLQQQAASAAPALTNGNQVQWFRPGDWKGDVFDYEGFKEPFTTEDAENGFVDANKDPNNPGTTGDLITAITQIDYMDCMERAFRARNAYPLPRAMALMAGRKTGHGDPKGTFIETATEYVRRLAKQAKA
jgi:hypothetical protein